MTPPAPIRAALLATVHAVTEWLPVSSSGHTALAADVAGWPEASPDRTRERRALEVALHVGSLIPVGARLLGILRGSQRPGAILAAGAAATAVTSATGFITGPLIERRFAGPRAVAAGLVAGSIALLAAERRAATTGSRTLGEAQPADAILVGLAQGAALWPGVSRRAATLAAARISGFDRASADAISWAAAVPTLVAAAAWQGTRSRTELQRAPAAPIAGALTAAGIGWATRSLPDRTAGWPAAVWAGWRVLLAAATLRAAHPRSDAAR